MHDTSEIEASSEVTYFGIKDDLDKFARKYLVKVRAGSGEQGEGKSNDYGPDCGDFELEEENDTQVEDLTNSESVEHSPGGKEIFKESNQGYQERLEVNVKFFNFNFNFKVYFRTKSITSYKHIIK